MYPSKNIEQSFANNDSKNEFMISNVNQSQQCVKQQKQRAFPQEYQKMWNFMNMFMKNSQLMKDYCAKMSNSQYQSPPQNVENHRKRQFYVQQNKYRNYQVSPRAKNQHRKGQDVLKKYINKTQNQHPNMKQSNVSVQEDHIKQEYVNKQQVKQNKPLKVNPYDQIPIKSKFTESILNNESSCMNSNINEKKQISNKMLDQRPIQGVNRKWQQHIQSTLSNTNQNNKFISTGSQYPSHPSHYQTQGFNQLYNQNQHQNQSKSIKPFLKRGSRQYLSSGKDRSIAKKKKPVKQKNQKPLAVDKSIDKIQRSISPNRLLNKKRPPTDKSINKGSTKNIEKQSSPKVNRKQLQKISHSPSFKRINDNPSSPGIKKKKSAKTNVFEDQSSSQNQQQIFKIKPRSSLRDIPKQQVIPGVFLTKGQLKQLLQKHGKANNSTYQDQKIKELKKKYIDLCNVATEQKQYYEGQRQILNKQKQQFESYKASQLSKIKNQRKLQQKQLLDRQTQNNNLQKQKEQIQIMKKQVQREKQQYKKKDKNNRIILEKYKKQIQQMKIKLNSYGNQKKSQYLYNQGNANNTKKESLKKPSIKNNKIQKQQFQQDYNQDDKKRKTSRHQKQKIQQKFKNSRYKTNKIQNQYQIEENPYEKSKKTKFYYKQNQYEKKKIASSSESDYEEDNQDQKQQIVQYNRKMTYSDLTKIPLSIKMVTQEMVQNMFKYKNNNQYLSYLSIVKGNRQKLSTTRNTIQKKLTNIYRDGGKQMIYQNGVKKQYFPNGYSIVFFGNGDIKQKLSDGTVLYYYRDRQVDQITLVDNTHIYRFQNNQIQFHHEDKRIEIRHPDGSLKVM